MSKAMNQTIKTYDYYWRPVIVQRRATVSEIMTDNARTYGTYIADDGIRYTVWKDSDGAWQLASPKTIQ